MAAADFSLKERDKSRLIKDRLIRYIVTMGGVAVFGALMLIFVYLASVVIPLFSPATLSISQSYPVNTDKAYSSIGIDDHGGYFFTLDERSELSIVDVSTGEVAQQTWLDKSANHIVKSVGSFNWYATLTSNNRVSLHRIHGSNLNDAHVVDSPRNLQGIELPIEANRQVQHTAFAVQEQYGELSEAWLVIADETNALSALQIRFNEFNGRYETNTITISNGFDQVDQILMIPNGRLLYVRMGNDLAIFEKVGHRYSVREVISLKRDNEDSIKNIQLLSGAYSLLVTYQDNSVGQWFDVVRDGQRSLSFIRDFSLSEPLVDILPDSYRKGFYSFHQDGWVESTFTTNSNNVYSDALFEQAPSMVAMSNNEQYLLALVKNSWVVVDVDNAYPEISFSALWQKLWYENYPEPDYVWQSTSADDNFEPKFSLVPIAFGTIKAALFAMLFSVPIAICGAIYTAYFMSARMRKVVKPTIELMEALPTVIIGFLAGLWLAPIVEQNLTAILLLAVLLPLTTFFVGVVWSLLPKVWLSALPKGWHSLILIPAYLLIIYIGFTQGTFVERWLFDGDARLFLASHGIDYDQRNALVVGFAMGFAVIPTIFTIAEDAIFSVPKHLSDGSLALGATPWQALTTVVLVTAVPGIFSAVMMGLGRAVGETMIVLMATGNTPIMDWNIFEGMRSLSATIAVETPESEVGSAHYRLLFLAALILFTFTFAVNSVAEWVRQRLRDKYRSL
ncbi:ABC transporter permease subunit [Vibrio maerlii]|uniref:ABC transporter permease subunit n=1 Tax=Vibrio maerlii TaxID=2231648 RepID=UPI000E3D98DA|nr:ABC transporter permease subunit [Vibrio maerlii]